MAKKTKNIHYINNSEFSLAIVEYVKEVTLAKQKEEKLPIVPDYIARSFLQIAENLSHKSNFIRYTYREEMVMDAVENCLKAISNYDIEAATRTGKPNAFAYFTQITWYAFLRRIAKEKKQQSIKIKYIANSGVEDFMIDENGDATSGLVAGHFVDTLKSRIEKIRHIDNEIKVYKKQEEKKARKKRTVHADSDLSEFL